MYSLSYLLPTDAHAVKSYGLRVGKQATAGKRPDVHSPLVGDPAHGSQNHPRAKRLPHVEHSLRQRQALRPMDRNRPP